MFSIHNFLDMNIKASLSATGTTNLLDDIFMRKFFEKCYFSYSCTRNTISFSENYYTTQGDRVTIKQIQNVCSFDQLAHLKKNSH